MEIGKAETMNSGQGTIGSVLGDGRRALSEEVLVGYKRTEVGVIPEEWSVFYIGELFDYLRTASNSRADLGDTGVVAYVHYGDIHTRFHHFIDFSRDNVPRLLAGKSVTAARLRDGDLIVADASEDEAGVGKSVEVRNLGTTEAVSGLHTFLLRSKDRRVHDGYRGYLLEKEPVKGQLRRLATGLKVFGISKQALRDVRIPLPSPAEQRAIAEALSDVDGMLAALEALVVKKRAIKQAAMQQLLTGKSRLPGFSGKWREVAIGLFANVVRGASPRPIDSPVWFDSQSKIGWLRISDVTASGKFLYDTIQNLSAAGIANSRFVKSGNLVMSICATVGKPIIMRKDVCIHDGFVVFDNLRADKEYLYYFLSNMEESWSKHGQTGSQMNLNTDLINSTSVLLPPPAEQRAIAEALSDMDAEIAALERRRDKTRVVKQGMMQQLLTGRVRLVKSEVIKKESEALLP